MQQRIGHYAPDGSICYYPKISFPEWECPKCGAQLRREVL